MAELIKELAGHSGSKIYLMDGDLGPFVRKENNVERNIERLDFLYKKGYNVPKLYVVNGNCLDMEYIHGLDIKNYLKSNEIIGLKHFIVDTLQSFKIGSTKKDYTEVYHNKLQWLSNEFPFTKEELIEKLPKILPQSTYHGDLTLENIIHTDQGFYMIDAMTSEYDSYIFDIAKLRQDLECRWFIRNDNLKLDVKLKNLQDNILDAFPFANNDYLLILMLLRVYPYMKDDLNKDFIMKEITRLWK